MFGLYLVKCKSCNFQRRNIYDICLGKYNQLCQLCDVYWTRKMSDPW